MKNNRNRNKRRETERKLNNIIRHVCCWNCFQVGHKRFQCPFPKTPSCSFCRRPQVLTVECGCAASRSHFQISDPQNQLHTQLSNYNLEVVGPVSNRNEVAEFDEMDNLVVVIENENAYDNDSDFLELHAESDNLEDI